MPKEKTKVNHLMKDMVLYSVGFWVPYLIVVLCQLAILTDVQFALTLAVGISAMLIVVGYAMGKRDVGFAFYAIAIILDAVFAYITAWCIFVGLLSLYALALGFILFLAILSAISCVIE